MIKAVESQNNPGKLVKKAVLGSVGLSFLFVVLGAVLGWWIIYELIHPEPALTFLYNALGAGAGFIYLQVVLSLKAGERQVSRLLLAGGLYVSIAWTALSFFAPLLFFPELPVYAKLLSVLAVGLFCFQNIRIGLRIAEKLWNGYGAFAFSKNLNDSNTSVHWAKVDEAMQGRWNVKPLGAPLRWHGIISKILYSFAVVGLYLAGLYSIFAVITWAVPATIAAGVMLQHASHSFFQAHRVWVWERENGIALKWRSSPIRRKKK